MQVTSTAYARLLGLNNQPPIYLVIFNGIPTRYSTGTVQNALGTTKTLLRIPTGAGQQITPSEGRSSLGVLNFSILDQNAEVTFLQQQYQLANRLFTMKMGYPGIDEAAYATVFVGQVLSFTLDQDNTFYTFSTLDRQKILSTEIFNAANNLSIAVAPGDTTINVKGTAKFASATGVLPNAQFYIRIDNEVISYTGVTPTSFTGCTRGALLTTPAAHSLNAKVKNFIVMQDNPLNIALQILTSTGLGTNGPFDILPASCGVGIPQAQVNVTRFQRERDRWLTSRTFRFEEEDKITAKAFLEQQIYTFLPAYPVVDNNGLLSVKVVAAPLPNDILSQAPLTDDNISQRPSFAGNVLDQYFFNELDLQYDYDFTTKTFFKESFYEDATSQGVYGQVSTKAYSSRGIRTSLLPQPVIDNFGLRFLKRYATAAPQLKANGFLSTRLIEVGDTVPLTSAKLPNLQTGKIGVVSQLMEVVGISPLYQAGAITYDLLNTPYSYKRRYAAITPTTRPPINFPVYSAATPAQKNYAFISTKINNTRGIMKNGDDGYYITP